MTPDDIKASLTDAIQESGLILQVRQMGSQLVIMMNCPRHKADAQFQETASTLLNQLGSLNLPKITSAKFYGKREGNPQPEWQHTQNFPATPSPPSPPPVQEKLPMAIKTFVTAKKETPNLQKNLGSLQGIQESGLLVPGLLAGILVVQILTGLASLGSVTWEYKIESVSDLLFTEMMDGYGDEGWELVTARRAQDSAGNFSYECIFKRVAR